MPRISKRTPPAVSPSPTGPAVGAARVFRHATDPTAKPAPAPSNNGPRVYADAAVELRDIGETLFGLDPWVPRLAAEIGEHPRQVRRWLNGEAQATEIALHRARLAVRKHAERIRRLQVRLGQVEP